MTRFQPISSASLKRGARNPILPAPFPLTPDCRTEVRFPLQLPVQQQSKQVRLAPRTSHLNCSTFGRQRFRISAFQFFYEMFTSVPSSIDQARSRLNRSERLLRFSNGRGRLRLNWSEHLILLAIDSRVSRPCLAPFLCCSRSASGCLQELRRLRPPADVSLGVVEEAQRTAAPKNRRQFRLARRRR